MKSRRIGSIAIRLLIFVMILLGIGEVAARLWLASHIPPADTAASAPKERRLSSSQLASYWSEEFDQERIAALKSFTFDDRGLFIGNFNGKWVNIDKGIRRTTDQPAAPRHSIYMFGNSQLQG